MNKEFAVHMLNDDGKAKAQAIAEAFDECLQKVGFLVIDARCAAVMRTKLEEACFFAKKGMATADFNQASPPNGNAASDE